MTNATAPKNDTPPPYPTHPIPTVNTPTTKNTPVPNIPHDVTDIPTDPFPNAPEVVGIRCFVLFIIFKYLAG